MAKESISIRVEPEKKDRLYGICETDNVNVADVLRNYIDLILKSKSTTINNNDNDENFKFIINKIQEDNDKIIELLKSQLEEKDKQLNQKNKLIENMQVLMKEEQQLLKEVQNKSILLLEDKNSQSKTSWFPFFNKKNI